MIDRGTRPILGRVAYSVGYALGRADSMIEAGADALSDLSVADLASNFGPGPTGREVGESPAYRSTTADDWSDDQTGTDEFGRAPGLDELGSAGYTLGAVAAGWVLTRLLRPHPVNWPRAVLAGTVATALSDIVSTVLPTDSDDDRRHFPPGPEDLPRYAAGIAIAAAYGSQFYPRLPGSPLTRGLIFGTVEATAAGSGGTIGLVQRYLPQLRLPLSSFAVPATEPRGTIASLAFGLGLALYSGKPRPRSRKKGVERAGKGQRARR